MPTGWKGWAVWAVAQAALTIAWRLAYKLGENAVLGWGDDQIAQWFGFSSPTAATIIAWGIPIALAAATLWIYHLIQMHLSPIPATAGNGQPTTAGRFIFRRSNSDRWERETKELRERYLLAAPPINLERGWLDYVVDGLQAIEDVTKLMLASAAETNDLGRFIGRHAARRLPSDFKKKRSTISKIAAYINSYSDKMEHAATLLGAITPILRDNQTRSIEQSEIKSKFDYDVGKNFWSALEGNIVAIDDAIKNIEKLRESTNGLRGISGDMNAASARIYSVIGDLITEVDRYRNVCKDLRSLVQQKVESVANIYEPK